MAFPTSPSNGQIYNQYVYNSTSSAWNKVDPGKYFDVGFIYTQYPGMDAPSTLGWYGTWSNVSSSFAGDFFRAEGGDALAFEAGEQLDQFQGHWHSGNKYTGGTGNNSEGYGDGNLGLKEMQIRDPKTDGVNGSPRTGNETRPVNQTIRIWKRTA